MEKEKKRNLPVVKYIIIIIVLANVLISVVPTLIDSAGDLFGESETEKLFGSADYQCQFSGGS